MNDAGAVCCIECTRQLDRTAECEVERERALLEPLGERLAIEVLHDQICRAVLFADVVQRADVRVVELGNRARFTIEALAETRVGGERVRQDLDRDGAVETGIAGLVDLAHTAGTDRALNLVGTEARAGGQHWLSLLDSLRVLSAS